SNPSLFFLPLLPLQRPHFAMVALSAFLLAVSLAATHTAQAAITVYHANDQHAFTTSTTSSPGASAGAQATYVGPAAYNPSTLVPPPVPTPTVLTTLPIQLQSQGTPNLGIPQKGSFFGFSIEMSVTNQVLGKNSSLLQVPFLNLMANIQQRAGSIMIRVGGNTQESATLVPVGQIPNGRILQKNLTGVTGTTQTPPLDFTPDLLYLMRNISTLVNAHWFLGVPWFITQPFDLAIVKAADEILGDYLLGLQAGNEPDMYTLHGHRPTTYSQFDYMGEFSDFLTQLSASGNDPTGRAAANLIGPNIATFAWTLESVWDAGFVDKFGQNLAYLAAEKYPADNCGATFGSGNAINPQSVLPDYLNHAGHVNLLNQYLNSTMYAQSKNKPFLMFETNTASCGGFLGISDSFAAALWGVDYALLMAHSNFSGAMFHIGGENVFYNPFTAPPTNQSSFRQWTIGPIYYSALVVAEALGASNQTQVLNLGVPGLSDFTPLYGLYENGVPKRVAIINYIDDPSGANDVHAVISIAGWTAPNSVKVKYLAAASVVQKGNITWAGQVRRRWYSTYIFCVLLMVCQTFGGVFESDGRPMGTEVIQTVNCDTTAQTCTVVVPAPGMALVFLSDDAQTESGGMPSMTFSTSAHTKFKNTGAWLRSMWILSHPFLTCTAATVDPAVLATSNGMRMSEYGLAGTSKPPSAGQNVRVSVVTLALGVLAATVLVMGRL
ncbi:unnamed protein product, partial [Mycena citricolor]